MHPQTAQAFEEIDAAIFSGEMLQVPHDLAQLTLYVNRWTNAMAENVCTKPTVTAHAPATKLVSMNMNGNLHQVANYVSKFGLSDFFVQAESSGGTSIVMFKLPIDWPVDAHGPMPATPRP